MVCAALRTSAAAVIVEQKKLDEYVIHAGCSLIPFGLELNPVESCGYLGPLGLDEWRALHKIMPSNGGLREDDARRGLGLDSTGIVDHTFARALFVNYQQNLRVTCGESDMHTFV